LVELLWCSRFRCVSISAGEKTVERIKPLVRATFRPEVVGDIAARSDISGKVHASYAAFRERSAPWSRVSIEAVLREHRGNRRKAAQVLGIGERTLYRKLKEYQLAV